MVNQLNLSLIGIPFLLKGRKNTSFQHFRKRDKLFFLL